MNFNSRYRTRAGSPNNRLPFFIIGPLMVRSAWCQLFLLGGTTAATSPQFSTMTCASAVGASTTTTAWLHPCPIRATGRKGYSSSTSSGSPTKCLAYAPSVPSHKIGWGVSSSSSSSSSSLLSTRVRRLSSIDVSSSSSSSSFSTTTTLFATSSTNLEFGTFQDYMDINYNTTVVIGRTDSLKEIILGEQQEKEEEMFLNQMFQNDNIQLIPKPILQTMMNKMDDKKGGSSTTLLLRNDDDDDNEDTTMVHKFSIGGLPCKDISRYNHPMSVHTVTKKVRALCPTIKGANTRLIVIVPEEENGGIAGSSSGTTIGPLASAIAKAFPLFSKKTTAESRKATTNKDSTTTTPKSKSKNHNIHVTFVSAKDGSVIDNIDSLKAAKAGASGVRLAGRLVDSHPELLTTTQFAKEVEAIVNKYSDTVTMTQIIGEQLRPYGGLYGVGKAATCPPRLIVLEYDGRPSPNEEEGGDDDDVIALVGKGIVYDTGGLSLKTKAGMSGMKHDMGGAAGLLGGFYAAVQLGLPKKVYCVLCLAENAIGPTAFRNDDILTMYSGKTVEVNNCDAEGRLVLGDGVAHVTKHLKDVTLVVDMATLTGAQLVATGRKHAGILANTIAVEERAMQAAMTSGDLCFPLLYAPDLLMSEFASKVADMKNSVKDRSNAQTSCAGHFIESHLDEDYKGGWLHVDMAGPGTAEQRGTGFGVGLVLSLLKAPGF